jgi:hypothetical protein
VEGISTGWFSDAMIAVEGARKRDSCRRVESTRSTSLGGSGSSTAMVGVRSMRGIENWFESSDLSGSISPSGISPSQFFFVGNARSVSQRLAAKDTLQCSDSNYDGVIWRIVGSFWSVRAKLDSNDLMLCPSVETLGRGQPREPGKRRSREA